MTPSKTYLVNEATRKLESYCAYQERCHKEVVEKLKGMRMIPEAIDTIIVHLIQNNYLNEERFAKSFARGKFNIKKWGKSRIIHELQLREISKYNIQNALKEINEDEYHNTLNAIAQKRWSQLGDLSIPKKRKKLMDYLFYRGWESNLVYEKIKELG